MNNVQKLKQTVLKVQKIRKTYGEDLEGKINAEDNLDETFRLLNKQRAALELNFLEEEKQPFYIFCGIKYGSYRPFKCNKKGRILAVPMCYCVSLYQYDLEAALPEGDVQIPFALRGFWKMEQVVQFLEDFVKFQNRAQNRLLWEHRRLKNQGKVKAKKYYKILDEFILVRTTNSGWKKEISYGDSRFVINTKNVKLDVVPLCKILTRYYANVIAKIDQYLETSASKTETTVLENVKEEFTKIMEQYFINLV